MDSDNPVHGKFIQKGHIEMGRVRRSQAYDERERKKRGGGVMEMQDRRQNKLM